MSTNSVTGPPEVPQAVSTVGRLANADAAIDYPFTADRPSCPDFAACILANSAAIRRRAMGRVRAAGLPWIDSDDIESSTLRRLDMALMRGLLRPRSEREL